MSLKKINNIKISPNAKSSRFLIDLKQELGAAESHELNQRKSSISVESRLEKLTELGCKKCLAAGQKRAKAMMLNFKNKLVADYGFGADRPMARTKRGAAAKSRRARTQGDSGKTADLLSQIAFIVLAKAILVIFKKLFELLYKICYIVGWVITFIARFIYFILKAIVRPAVTGLIHWLVKLKIKTALAILMRSFLPWWQLVKVGKKNLPPILGGGGERVDSTNYKSFYPSENPPSRPFYQGGTIQRGVAQERGIGGYLRPVLIFAGVLWLLILPVKALTYYQTINSAKGKVLGISEIAINDLISGGQAAANFDFNQADKSFTAAGNNFITAQNQLNEINGLVFTLAAILPDQNVKLAAASRRLARAGEFSAAVGRNLSLAASSLFDSGAADNQLVLSNLSAYGRQAIINLNGLTAELNQINSASLPESYRREFVLLKQKIALLNRGLNGFIGLADQLDNFLGRGRLKRYLLVFQNNSELRASGGFIGSFALVDFLNGKIKKIEAPGGGSYDTDAGLLKKIKSPEPLRLVRPDWHFWDANWWPDWPMSAKKLAWFYENSGGPTVDGVIGFTPTVAENILRAIGPVDLKEKYGVVIEADNFWRTIQEFAEQKPNITKQPKKIIGDLMNKIIEELPARLNKNNFIDLLKIFEESLADKNILFYFTDQELQSQAQALGGDGRLKETPGDYISVINTNIAGGKSDRRIKQQISHQAEIEPDGAIIDNLTISRTHEAVKRESFVGVRNVDWLRVYVPLGSKLISAAGFRPVDKIFFKAADPSWQNDPDLAPAESSEQTDESSGTKIYNELGKTVFANWSQLDPGESIEIKIKYQLPFKLTDQSAKPAPALVDNFLNQLSLAISSEEKNYYTYSLLAQKQPGMNSSLLLSQLKFSDNFRPIGKFPDDLSQYQNGWFRSENFNEDKLMAVMLEEK